MMFFHLFSVSVLVVFAAGNDERCGDGREKFSGLPDSEGIEDGEESLSGSQENEDDSPTQAERERERERAREREGELEPLDVQAVTAAKVEFWKR